MRSVWWPVALLCPPPAIRRGSEPQSVALVGPFWGWGPGAVPPWLRPTRTIPQRSKDNCTAMLSLIRTQPIFYPCQVGCVFRFRRLRFLLRVISSPRIAAFTELTSQPYPGLWSAFPSHGRFVFQDFRAPPARLLWPAAGYFPLPPSQVLGVISSPPPDLMLGLDIKRRCVACQHSPDDQTLRLQAGAGEDDVIHLPSGLDRVDCEEEGLDILTYS